MPIVMQCCGNMKEDKKKQAKKHAKIKCPKNRGIACESMQPNPRLKIKTTLSHLYKTEERGCKWGNVPMSPQCCEP